MLTLAIGHNAMLLLHVGKNCIGLHVSLETPQIGAQKAQMPMGVDMVVDGYVVRPHIITEQAVATADIVNLPMIDGNTIFQMFRDL